MEYYSTIKKKTVLPFATARMNLQDIMFKWNKPDTVRQILYGIAYMKYLK